MGETPTDKFPKTTLFDNSSDFTYRIPSLVYLQQGKKNGKRYLAFAEKRTSIADEDAKCLVIRRGTITDDGSLKWSDCEELSTAQLQGYRSMNPCPVYDSSTETLFLFFICVVGNIKEQDQIDEGRNQTRLCLVTSGDHGDNWSNAEDLTENVIGGAYSRWATFAVGPGHGVRLAAGRLVVPAYAYVRFSAKGTFEQRALSIFSDDAGVTWHMCDPLGFISGECEMAEVTESGVSQLYCSARRKGTRLEVVSCDHGEHFKESSYSGARLAEHEEGCQGSVISFPAPEPSESVSTWLAFSHPTKPDRHDLGVYLNRMPMSNSTWDSPMVINKGLSGYSDLAYNQDDHSFSCLLECGKEPKPGEKSKPERIDFTSFKLDDIRRPRELKMKNVNLKVGDQLRVKGFIPAGADRFIINLGTGERDLALHFNPTFQEDGKTLVVCKELTAGKWGQEKSQLCPVICRGQNIKMVFKLMEDKFRVELPGGQEVDFPNRQAIQVISYVSVERDLKLSALEIF